MKKINFYKNWNNKLGCQFFCTIRPDWLYYIEGEHYDIVLKGKSLFEGRIIQIKRFMLHELNDFTAYIDAGLSAEKLKEQIRKMYPNKDFTKDKMCIILILNTEF